MLARPLRRLFLASTLLIAHGLAQAADIVFIAPTNHTEPLAHFESGQLRGGLLRDIGDALARRLDLRPRYLSVPSKRVAETLRSGGADLVCHVLPGWLDGDFHWTVPVLPNAEVIAARTDAPAIQQLSDLEGRRVGTVIGYRYSHMLPAPDRPLPFERFDAPDARANLAKLVAGRMSYAVAEELTVRDYVRRHPEAGLKIALVVSRYTGQCALSKASKLDFEAVNAALTALTRDGEIKRILSWYGG